MTKRTYCCNVCRAEIPPERESEVIGFDWYGVNEVRQQHPRDVEHHICVKCLANVVSLSQQVAKKSAIESYVEGKVEVSVQVFSKDHSAWGTVMIPKSEEKHVCGLSGFGVDSDDTCARCQAEAEAKSLAIDGLAQLKAGKFGTQRAVFVRQWQGPRACAPEAA